MKKIVFVLLGLFSIVGFGQSDLEFDSYYIGVSGSTIFKGVDIPWVFTAINNGSSGASVVDYKIYLSEDEIIDTTDIQLKSGKIGQSLAGEIGLEPGGEITHRAIPSGFIRIPLDIEANKTYYFIYWIEQDIVGGETNISNNVATQSVFISLGNNVSVVPKDGSDLGDRSPLLLIHGWQTESVPAPGVISIWDNLVYYYDNDLEFQDYFKIYYVRYVSNLITVNDIGHELRYDLDDITEFQGKQISIIAHSMGGLVSKSFMNRTVNSGYYSGQQGGERIDKLITLGTPHHGSPMANGDSRETAFSNNIPINLFNRFDDAFAPVKFDKYSRIDLYWDNYRSPDLLDYNIYPLESNDWLNSDKMNGDSTFDSKIIAYAGSFHLLDVPSNPLTSVYPPYISYITYSGYQLGNIVLYKMWNSKYNESHLNDGIVPLSSALFYNHTILKRRFFFGYNHKRIAYGMSNYYKVLTGEEEPDYLLFNSIKNDLLELPAYPQILVSLNGLEFPETAIGNSVTKDIVIQNVGDVDLTITSLQLSGIDNAHFQFNAPNVPFDILTNETIDVTVSFEPQSIGNKTVDFIINNSSSNNSSVVLTYTGEAVQIAETDYNTNIDPTYDFGDVYIYGGSNLVTLNVSNSSSAPYTVVGLNITGSNANLFSIVQQPDLPKLFNPGDSETIILSFDPDTIGEKTAIIEASFQNNSILDTANLIGYGVNTIDNPNAPKLTYYEYWFNNDYFAKQATNLSAENSIESLDFDAVTTGVNNGLNTLHFRVKDDENHWSSILSEFVYIQNTSNSASNLVNEYEYWFDNDYAGRMVGSGTGSNPLILGLNDNVGSLETGLHQFHIRCKDEKGAWSSIVSEFIYNNKPIGLGNNLISAYRYWFDDNFADRTSGTFTPEETIIFIDAIDTSGLTVNTSNFIHFQFKDIYGNWSSVLTEEFSLEKLILNSNFLLQGASINPFTGEENLMRDELRVANLLPTTSPYSDGLTCDISVFTSTGSNAIVDWVWVELRDATDETIVVASKSALLQRDGDVVDVDGTSAVPFNISKGTYYVVVNHKSHLGVMTASPIVISGAGVSVDFTLSESYSQGGSLSVMQLPNGTYAIFAGDTDGNGQVQNSDILSIQPLIGTPGYLSQDVDLNGQVQNIDLFLVQPNIGKAQQFND